MNDHDITNATLAAFAAPIVNRDWKVTIAQRTLRRISPDVMMGGGEGYWYPRGDEGMIPNEVPDEDRSLGEDNLVEEAIGLGYEYAYDRETVDDLTGPKALALVQDSGLQRYKELKGYKPRTTPTTSRSRTSSRRRSRSSARIPTGSSWSPRATTSTRRRTSTTART